MYFGVGDLNMRSHATVNFRQEELPELAEIENVIGESEEYEYEFEKDDAQMTIAEMTRADRADEELTDWAPEEDAGSAAALADTEIDARTLAEAEEN